MTDSDASVVRAWADQLPSPLLAQLSSAMRVGPKAVAGLRGGSFGTSSKAVLNDAFARTQAGDGEYLAGLLAGYLAARGEQPTVVPAWTGPTTPEARGSRLTLAVVAGLIDEAQEQILLVSYATSPSPEVRQALVRAVARGVRIIALLERPQDNPQFNGHSNPLAGIAHTALHWPTSAREPGASMHAKILVIDREAALVGSANLTGYGVERNLECGVLIRGGSLPRAICGHIDNLSHSTLQGGSDG